MNATIHQFDAVDYHADPCAQPSLSPSSAIRLLKASERHVWAEHPRLGGRRREFKAQAKKVMEYGDLIHRMLLGKGKDMEVVLAKTKDGELVPAMNLKSKFAGEHLKEIRATGKIPVLRHVKERAEQEAIPEIVRQLRGFGITLSDCSEHTIVWHESSSNGPVLCRTMLDNLHTEDGLIIEIKVTGCARPDVCCSQIDRMGYDVQDAAHRSAVRAWRPEIVGREDSIIVFCEASYPYLVTPLRPDAEMRESGAQKWARAVHRWAQALKTGNWRGYVDGITLATLPRYAIAREADAQATDDLRESPEVPAPDRSDDVEDDDELF
jgi:hypothetical protein